MKTQTLLNYMMATIIVVLLFYIRTSAEFTETKPVSEFLSQGPGACNYSDVNGFSPAKEIAKTDARSQTAAFQEFASRQGMTIVGGVISKTAIDSLLCGNSYNGIAYQFAIDPSGKSSPSNAVTIVLGAVKVEEVDRNMTITSQGHSFYTTNLWCPPSCMSFQ